MTYNPYGGYPNSTIPQIPGRKVPPVVTTVPQRTAPAHAFSGEPANGWFSPSGNNYNRMVQDYLKNALNGGSNYSGHLGVSQSPIERNLLDTVTRQLHGQGLGMTQEEMNAMLGLVRDQLNTQRQTGVTGTMQQMNQRGLLGSDITAAGLNKVEEDYAKALSQAQADMLMQNESIKRQQYSNAMGMAMNLSNMDYSRQTMNSDREYQNWLNSQQIPWNMLMQYQQNFNLPNQQQNSQLWNTMGSLLGAVLPFLIKK